MEIKSPGSKVRWDNVWEEKLARNKPSQGQMFMIKKTRRMIHGIQG